MALTLIKEDGTGRTDANSYASVAEGDAYFEGHVYPAAWTGATADKKAAALVMATRLIDSQFQFCGYRAHSEQALQWPRAECPDPDRGLVTVSALQPILSDFVPYDSVPKAVVQATCEVARTLLVEDRTANPVGEGLKFSALSSLQQSFDKNDTRPVISRVAQVMLGKFGTLLSRKGGVVRLERV